MRSYKRLYDGHFGCITAAHVLKETTQVVVAYRNTLGQPRRAGSVDYISEVGSIRYTLLIFDTVLPGVSVEYFKFTCIEYYFACRIIQDIINPALWIFNI